jgi:hypothetical protein
LPPARVATIGRPHAAASMRTVGTASLRDGRSTSVEPRMICGTSSRRPAMTTRSAIPSSSIRLRMFASSTPAPTSSSRASGTRSSTAGQARRASSWPLRRWKAATKAATGTPGGMPRSSGSSAGSVLNSDRSMPL